jgi:hypothetical protein
LTSIGVVAEEARLGGCIQPLHCAFDVRFDDERTLFGRQFLVVASCGGAGNDTSDVVTIFGGDSGGFFDDLSLIQCAGKLICVDQLDRQSSSILCREVNLSTITRY